MPISGKAMMMAGEKCIVCFQGVYVEIKGEFVRCDKCGESRHRRMMLRDYIEKKRLGLKAMLAKRKELLVEINERLRGENDGC